jgi:hypothetical protein
LYKQSTLTTKIKRLIRSTPGAGAVTASGSGLGWAASLGLALAVTGARPGAGAISGAASGARAASRVGPGPRAGARTTLFVNLEPAALQLELVLVVQGVVHSSAVGELDDPFTVTLVVNIRVGDLAGRAEVILQVLEQNN